MSIKLRAHHLLCMQGFQGYGYDKKFVDNLQRVIQELNSNGDQSIEITASSDIVCAHCPHLNAQKCQKSPNADDEIIKLDKLVLKKLNLAENTVLPFKLALQTVSELFDRQAALETCSNCSWREKCSWFLRFL